MKLEYYYLDHTDRTMQFDLTTTKITGWKIEQWEHPSGNLCIDFEDGSSCYPVISSIIESKAFIKHLETDYKHLKQK